VEGVLAVGSKSLDATRREQPLWRTRQSAPVTTRRLKPEASAELLRTIAGVLDVRTVFHRISYIVKQAMPHDSLVLTFLNRAGHVTLWARSTRDLPEHGWTAGSVNSDFTIVGDLRETLAEAADGQPSNVDRLITAGYRSLLSVRALAQEDVIQLAFLSKQTDVYTPDDVPGARHVADCVAVSVAHAQLAAAERHHAEARGRAERVAARVRAVADQREPNPARVRIVGRSAEWQRVLTRALRVASTDTTVFLQGESGTGKEVIAQFIHESSVRKDGPFVAINCAALPEQLLESEMFGHERGAFTGALQPKAGHVELAARGTLFLDEVSEMSLLAQAKLLRFLQQREFQRLGGTRVQKANVRVIAATNCHLRQAVAQGTFRNDLFYRLQVFDIQLPALRERRGDVLLLAEHFLRAFAETSGGTPARLSGKACDALLAHTWPGNIRELRNVLETAAILNEEGVIEPCHLSLQSTVPVAADTQDLQTIERRTIERVLQQTRWNKSRTARQLGLTRTQLYGRLRRHGLENR